MPSFNEIYIPRKGVDIFIEICETSSYTPLQTSKYYNSPFFWNDAYMKSYVRCMTVPLSQHNTKFGSTPGLKLDTALSSAKIHLRAFAVGGLSAAILFKSAYSVFHCHLASSASTSCTWAVEDVHSANSHHRISSPLQKFILRRKSAWKRNYRRLWLRLSQ